MQQTPSPCPAEVTHPLRLARRLIFSSTKRRSGLCVLPPSGKENKCLCDQNEVGNSAQCIST